MGAPASMKALVGRRLDIAEQECLLAMFARIEKRGGRLTPRETEVRRMLEKLRYGRRYSAGARVHGDRLTLEEVIAEMAELEARSRKERLSHEESERLGYLIAWEQRRAVDRPGRIARLQRELDLLLTLEAAAKGSAAIHDDAPTIDLSPSTEGWSVADRRAA